MIKPVSVTLNLLVFLSTLVLVYVEGIPDKPQYVLYILLLLITPLINFIVIKGFSDKDSLLSLWLGVKKKKLREELRK